MKAAFRYLVYLLFLLFITGVILELLLGIFFSYAALGIIPLQVKDHPYLYFLFENGLNGNKHGFMTPHPIKKPEGSYRIILTGGSVARGNHPDSTISAFLEKELNENIGTHKIEALNAGISAFMVEQEFILTQLVLQQYEPDMIVGLDGYNDILSFKLNIWFARDFPLPPHNWEDFRVIKENRFKSKPCSRLAYFFKNIHKVFIKNRAKPGFDFNEVKQDELNEISRVYWNIVDDSYDFCRAKQIAYFNFLQPVKYYSKKYSGEKLTPDLAALYRLYQTMESEITKRHYAFSLTSVMDEHMDWFTDECHVTADGNRLIAHAICQAIEDSVKAEILQRQETP